MYHNVVRTTLLSCLVLAALPSNADDKAEAKKHFEAGIALIESEDFEAAAAELEASVKLYSTKNNLYNLANCYRALHRYSEALALFEKVLGEYDKKLKKEMREDTEQQIDEINGFVGRLTIETNLEGARISVDEDEVGQSPLTEPLLLAPGAHRIEVSLEGYDTVEKTLEITSATDTTLPVTLDEAKAALTVKANVDGANVLVDGNAVGATPLVDPLILARGDYTITLTKEGYEPEEKKLTLERGGEAEANFDLVRIPTPVAEQPKTEPVQSKAEPEDKKKLGPLFWAGLAGTVVLGGVSGAMWGLAVSKKNKYNAIVNDATRLGNSYVDGDYLGLPFTHKSCQTVIDPPTVRSRDT